MLALDATARSAAPPEKVWDLLANVRTWPEWSSFDEAEVEKGSGLGELRRLRAGRVESRELVTVWDPPRRFGYDFLEGLPIVDYHSEVTLTEAGGGTEIRWRSSFRPKFPGTGWLFRRRLQSFVAETTEALARAAER